MRRQMRKEIRGAVRRVGIAKRRKMRKEKE